MAAFTPEAIKSMLDESGLPVSCGPFPDVPGQSSPPPPFILYDLEEDDFYADNKNYIHAAVLVVELYTRGREFPREIALEAVFREHGLAWGKDTDRMEKERLYVATYEIGVILSG
jgi:hypothetical protein